MARMRKYRVAAQGNAAGQASLGWMYEHCQGVPQDYAQAVTWYQQAGDEGDDGGQTDLGRMYEHGLSVARDFAQAVIWYRKAANQENAAAQYNADNGDFGAYDTLPAQRDLWLPGQCLPVSNNRNRKRAPSGALLFCVTAAGISRA